MSQVVYLHPQKRASKAGSVFSPIITQETINAQEAARKRRALRRKYTTYFRHVVARGVLYAKVEEMA